MSAHRPCLLVYLTFPLPPVTLQYSSKVKCKIGGQHDLVIKADSTHTGGPGSIPGAGRKKEKSLFQPLIIYKQTPVNFSFLF